MFLDFFYLLKSRGLSISVNEWQTLLYALEMGLHHSSLTGFYYLCRAILVKNEADFDRFDQVFLDFFESVHYDGEIPKDLMNWLNKPNTQGIEDLLRELEKKGFTSENMEEILNRLKERLKEQDSEHNFGNYWVGTHGKSPFGNSGWHPNGIRIGGESKYRTAMSVAGERRFRDFRKDNKMDTRRFQMAFRLLRQYTTLLPDTEMELDVDGTIHDTCNEGGNLKIRYRPKRKNAIKLLMLIDSGGSMDVYSTLVSQLFQASRKANHFKELHIYYFHNCIYEDVYLSPRLLKSQSVSTDILLKNFDKEYRVIIVGDAMMNEQELLGKRYDWDSGLFSKKSGIEWLMDFVNQYPYLIWLNPEPKPSSLNYWTQTYLQIMKIVDMFDLSVEGLEKGMKNLLSRKRTRKVSDEQIRKIREESKSVYYF